MQDHIIIDHLGGGTQVVTDLQREYPHLPKIGPHAVYRWKQHGIPMRWRFWVSQLALAKQVPGFDPDAFMGIKKPGKPKRRAA